MKCKKLCKELNLIYAVMNVSILKTAKNHIKG